MSTLKERLQEVMAEHGLKTQQQLADFAEVSKGLVGQWFNGLTGLGKKPLLAFERKTNYSTEWLADGTGNKYRGTPAAPLADEFTPALIADFPHKSATPKEKYVFTRLVKEKELTGKDAPPDKPVNDFCLPLSEAVLEEKKIKKDNIICGTLSGDNMSPLMPNGTLFAADKDCTDIINGQIYAFLHGGSFRIAYLENRPESQVRITLENNAKYPEETISLDKIDIIGRVFWWSVLV